MSWRLPIEIERRSTDAHEAFFPGCFRLHRAAQPDACRNLVAVDEDSLMHQIATWIERNGVVPPWSFSWITGEVVVTDRFKTNQQGVLGIVTYQGPWNEIAGRSTRHPPTART